MAHFQFVRKMWYSDAKGASSGRDRGWGIAEDVGKAGPGVGVAASDERPGVGAGAPRVERRDMEGAREHPAGKGGPPDIKRSLGLRCKHRVC